MKKLVLILSGLSFVGFGSIVPNFFSTTNNKTSLMNIHASPKEISITNKKIKTRGSDLDLRTDAINLTALGIKDNKALNDYANVELPEFQVSFLEGFKVVNSGYKWGAKMSEGEGDYAEVTRFSINNLGRSYMAIIERKHSLWYSGGNYFLALVYRFNCSGYIPGVGGKEYGQVESQVGSTVKFY